MMSSTVQVLLDRSDHLITDFRSLSKTRREIVLYLFELFAVAFEFAFHVAQLNSLAPVLRQG